MGGGGEAERCDWDGLGPRGPCTTEYRCNLISRKYSTSNRLSSTSIDNLFVVHYKRLD